MIELYDHQKTALGLLRLNDGFALFCEQGVGKSHPILFRIAELAESKRIASALIVAPKAVCEGWHEKIKGLSKSQKAALDSIFLDIVNYELISRRKQFEKARYDLVVFDESHYIKNPSAKRTKSCLKLAAKAKYRYILTGTPTSNGQLCNIWSQLAAIDPHVVKGSNNQTYVYPACLGGDSYYKWLDRVAYLNKWHQPYKYHHVNEIQQVIQEHAYQIKKEDCLDLPEKLPDEILYCDLTSEQKSDYKEMAKQSAILTLDTLAGNPLTRSLRLRQIASGFIDTENEDHKEYTCTKIQNLKDFLTDFDKKVVIFCDFRHSIDAVSYLLRRMKIKHVILDGRQKDKGVWRKFQNDQSIQAIVLQYNTGSAGIDLFAADTMIFYEPCLSSNVTLQAYDRIHRPGQTKACSYVWLLTSGTIEFAIYKALKNYEDFGDALFTQYLDEYTKGAELCLSN